MIVVLEYHYYSDCSIRIILTTLLVSLELCNPHADTLDVEALLSPQNASVMPDFHTYLKLSLHIYIYIKKKKIYIYIYIYIAWRIMY